MPEEEAVPQRGSKRKARTRAALVRAGQKLIAEGRTNVAVLDITRVAEVGMGSFYNHFDSKEDLYQAAVDDALEQQGNVLDELTKDLDDPAEVFAQSFRLTGRLHRLNPELSRVLLAHGPSLVTSDHGLAPRALRDLRRGNELGRFSIADPEIALMVAGGAALTLAQMLLSDPDRDAEETTDQMTEDLLRMFGLSPSDAKKTAHRPLPDLTELVRAAQG